MDLNKLYLYLDAKSRCDHFDSCSECREYYGIEDPENSDVCYDDDYMYVAEELRDYLKEYLDNYNNKIDITEDEVMQLLKDCELWTE